MTPSEFLKTIYLGDRSCKGIYIEGQSDRVSVHVDVISRIRSASGNWDYYVEEDLTDGRLVFTGVKAIRLEPSGPVPNDLINAIEVADVRRVPSGEQVTIFSLSISSVDKAGISTEVKIEIEAKGVHLEHAGKPGEAICS